MSSAKTYRASVEIISKQASTRTLCSHPSDARFIALNDGIDTLRKNNEMLVILKNVMNEFYARDTSRKIRAVNKAKGERGVPLTTNVPYDYI